MSESLVVRGARQLLTLRGPAETRNQPLEPRRGAALRDLGIIRDGAIIVKDGLVFEVGSSRRVESLFEARNCRELDVTGRVVMPGFVDTQSCLVGDRSSWSGEPADPTLLNNTSSRRLAARAGQFLLAMARHGTTTVEASSGRGIQARDEMKILPHFSLWAILAAPLIAGNDLRDMKPEIREILTQKEVIAVDQDPLGLQGRRVRKNGDLEVWSKALQDGGRAVILFNRGTASADVSVSWPELGYPAHMSAKVRDLWQAKELGEYKGKFSATVAPHSVVMVTVRP